MKVTLFQKHVSLNGRIIEFFGWNLPLYYDSVIKEHEAVRNEVGIFDVSHMGNFIVEGKEAYQFINLIISNNLNKIQPLTAIYSPLLYENGTFVDDIIVYYENDEKFFIILNASNIKKDFEWMKESIKKYNLEVKINDVSSKYSLLAIQGKNSLNYIKKLLPQYNLEKPFSFQHLLYEGEEIIVANTGYTGEKGVEVLIPNSIVNSFFSKALTLNITPCGLGARDSLRLEKGYSLYDNEINENYNALEAGLGWTVSFDKDFIGKDALLKIKEIGLKKKITGFIMEEKAFARSHQDICDENKEKIGEVTSGGYSPVLKKNLGLGYIPRDYKGDFFYIKIREKYYKALKNKRTFI